MWDNAFHFHKWLSDFFVGQPGHFWVVSAVLGVLFLAAIVSKTFFPRIHCWPLLIALLMWLFFGFTERDNVIRNVDIRIDVVFIWPFFFAGTALLIGLFILSIIRAVIARNTIDPTELNQRGPRLASPTILLALLDKSRGAPKQSIKGESSADTQPCVANPCASCQPHGPTIQPQKRNRTDAIKWQFAVIFLIAIPVLVHALCQGAYKMPSRGVFWIGPISTTIPYVFLTLLFLAHCFDLKSRSRRSAYCGAVMAWIGMMAFTVFLICQAPGPSRSSTIGIAMGLTPFLYIPFLVVPYIAGAIVGRLWTKWKDRHLPKR